MLSTKYQGTATVDGGRMSADLHLEVDHLGLSSGQEELLRWPIDTLEWQRLGGDVYEIRYQEEAFSFRPSQDNGLGEEISVRRRLAVLSPPPDPAEATPSANTIADRVMAAGQRTRRVAVPPLLGRRVRSVLFGIGSLTLAVTAGAALFVVFDAAPPASAPPQTQPAAPATDPSPDPGPDTLRVTEDTVAPAVAGATVTAPDPPPTSPPPSTTVPVDPDRALFEVGPEEVAARWDALVRDYNRSLFSGDFHASDGEFGFAAGPFVRIEGTTTDGIVDGVAFLGDPSGTTSDDRAVLIALGLTMALVEPDLSPEGRGELISTLGFDLDNPDVTGLDGTVDYRDRTWRLRWDPDLQRIVLEVRPGE